MFDINVTNLIYSIKEKVLPPQHFKDQLPDKSWKAIVISLDLSMNDYNIHKSKRGSVHFIFTRNTSVWYTFREGLHRWDEIPFNEWKNTSNHDSCWISDGVRSVLTKLYFEWAKEINPDIAPRDISQFCILGIIGFNPWEEITVRYEPIWKKLTNIKRGWE